MVLGGASLDFLEPVLKMADRVPEERQGSLESGIWPCGMWVGPGFLRGRVSGYQLSHISCYSAGRGLQELSEITSLGGKERDFSWLIKTLEKFSYQDNPSQPYSTNQNPGDTHPTLQDGAGYVSTWMMSASL